MAPPAGTDPGHGGGKEINLEHTPMSTRVSLRGRARVSAGHGGRPDPERERVRKALPTSLDRYPLEAGLIGFLGGKGGPPANTCRRAPRIN